MDRLSSTFSGISRGGAVVVGSVGRAWPSVAEIAASVRLHLLAGDEDMAFRLLMDGVNRLRLADAEGRLEEALREEPGSVGNRRWDTLLAASVRYRLHSMGRRPPDWTVKEPLDVFWFPMRVNPSQQYNDMAHTPAELMRVGIFIDEKEYTTA